MFSLPASALSVPTDSTLSVIFTLFRDDRLFPAKMENSTSIVSPVVDVSLAKATLNGSLEFTFVTFGFDVSKAYRCVFFVIQNNTWSSVGVTSTVTAAGVLCKSTHLTNFAVLVVSQIITEYSPDINYRSPS